MLSAASLISAMQLEGDDSYPSGRRENFKYRDVHLSESRTQVARVTPIKPRTCARVRARAPALDTKDSSFMMTDDSFAAFLISGDISKESLVSSWRLQICLA